MAAPAATSAGPRSTPPASTATVTVMASSVAVVVTRVRVDDRPAAVRAAVGADAVRCARCVTLRARVERRRADLVRRAALGRARVGLSLLGDGHEARQGSAPPA